MKMKMSLLLALLVVSLPSAWSSPSLYFNSSRELLAIFQGEIGQPIREKIGSDKAITSITRYEFDHWYNFRHNHNYRITTTSNCYLDVDVQYVPTQIPSRSPGNLTLTASDLKCGDLRGPQLESETPNPLQASLDELIALITDSSEKSIHRLIGDNRTILSIVRSKIGSEHSYRMRVTPDCFVDLVKGAAGPLNCAL